MKLIRDPIYGYIEVSDEFLKVISTPIFQRLRQIKQTAMAYMVYPGMTHTRFEHSLGVMYLSGELAKYIIKNSGLKYDDSFIKMISLAGLLHDIGHLAFSHTFENFLMLLKNVYGINVEENGKKTHVKFGKKIISEFLGSIIDKEFSKYYSDPVNFLQHILEEDPKNIDEKIALSLISNYIDADRSDYLLRDSYYAGVGYGKFDIERLKRFLVFIDNKLAVYGKAMPIVEQFLLSRMYMYENVYFHSVVGLYNAVLSHAMVEMYNKNLISLPEKYEDYLKLVDYFIYYNLHNSREEFQNSLLFRSNLRRIKTDITGNCIKKFDSIKKEIYEDMKNSGGLFIYHEFNDVPYYEEKEDAVYVFNGDNIAPLTTVSPIIRSLSEVKKATIGYFDSAENIAKKYEKIIQECKTLGP
ncbi:HD domain-containing protein [Acidianus sulfidivorans JP7]|uniref:Phosphohydrolase n=1 Tax=Acidianus sulfidivorans JP7 TaxID=619593 RepID=A0A2U9IPC9_9CREN|nr:HD domain-containing protein [Acidianus sulfidivorans]AWR97865.1 HD domain-containing protein [Acidianus sulfidivorans JP7]